MAPSFDLSLFQRALPVIGLQVEAHNVAGVLKELKGFVIRRKMIKNVITTETNHKIILLDPEQIAPPDNEDGPMPDLIRSTAKKYDASTCIHKIQLNYANFSTDEALRELLPKDLEEIPSAFEMAGHIAHMNLRDEHLPYKNIIGQVILDKNPSIKTVVNKIGNISNEFRTFPMEVLAGENNFLVNVSEGKVKFRFDFSKVYWNSRLQHEHEELVHRFHPDDIILDAFCGVGPFAIPAAMRGCKVYANDLNPESFAALQSNMQLNKITSSQISCSNMDARAYIKKIIHSDKIMPQHVVMNLPATAIEFLDSFRGIFDRVGAQSSSPSSTKRPLDVKLPKIHCYSFSRDVDDEYVEDLLSRAHASLGYKLQPSQVEIRLVRKVAPRKSMYCLHFDLPDEVAYGDDAK